jgi:outer membrane protein assembly factor BamC
VETDQAANVTRVYFHHHMVVSPETNAELGGDERWRIKPYNPVLEAEALYQAMIFFGSTSDVALAQLKVTGKMSEAFNGHQELEGLVLHATPSQSWGYLQAMVYRADWQVDRSDPDAQILWVKVPDDERQQGGLLSKLAFWKSEGAKVNLPETVMLRLQEDEENADRSILSAKAQEGDTPLNEAQRKYLFERLGLLGQ